jgi:hypothetical protein
MTGESGVIRFSSITDVLEVSINGGRTFDSLPSSGQIQESINQLSPDGGANQSLDDAYDLGNAINLHFDSSYGYRGVLLRETQPGLNPISVNDFTPQALRHYGLAVSGHAPNPDNPNSYAFARLVSNALAIQGSGQDSGGNDAPANIVIGVDVPGIPAVGVNENTAIMATSGRFVHYVGGNYNQNLDGIWTLATDSSVTHTYLGEVNKTAQASYNIVTFGFQEWDRVLRLTASQQLRLNAFTDAGTASGAMRFQIGPHKAWHVNNDNEAGNKWFPIAHSGQVLQMILENGGGDPSLQASYDGGNEINLSNQVTTLGPGPNNYGVVIKDQTPGSDPNILNSLGQPAGFGVAVSGANPFNSQFTHSIACLNSNGLYIRGSGLDATHANGPSRPVELFVGVSGQPWGDDQVASIRSTAGMEIVTPSGNLTLRSFGPDCNLVLNSEVDIEMSSGADISVTVGDDYNLVAQDQINLTSASDNITLTANAGGLNLLAAGNNTVWGINGSITVNNGSTKFIGLDDITHVVLGNDNSFVLSASGDSNFLVQAGGPVTLEAGHRDASAPGDKSGVFTFVPHDEHNTWQIKTGNDPEGTLNPIAHSGQVCGMIDDKIRTGRDLTYSWFISTNVERVFDNNAGDFIVPGPTTRNDDDPSGVIASYIMDVGQVDRFQVQFPVPHELDVSQPVSGMMYFRRASGGSDNTTAEMIWTLRVNNPGDNFSNTAEGTNIFALTPVDIPNGDNDDMLIAEIGTLLPGGTLTQDSFVHGSFSRDNVNNPNDDLTTDIDFIGVKFVGKRKP